MSVNLDQLVVERVADSDAIRTFHLTHHASLNNKYLQVRAQVALIKSLLNNCLSACRIVLHRYLRITIRVQCKMKLRLNRRPMKNTLKSLKLIAFYCWTRHRKNNFLLMAHLLGSLGNAPGSVFHCTWTSKIGRWLSEERSSWCTFLDRHSSILIGHQYCRAPPQSIIRTTY